MPELIIHKGYSIERIATTLSLTTEGIFGLPLGVASTFVFIFISSDSHFNVPIFALLSCVPFITRYIHKEKEQMNSAQFPIE